jgi:MOSC domain-containing protein YiiM
VLAVNVARVMDNPAHRVHGSTAKKPEQTGIDKRPVSEPVRLGRLGVGGDTICDTDNHGGADQAVYAYASEDAAWWQSELGDELGGRVLGPGAFGENLTLAGVEVTGAVVGEQWRVGGALLQVCVPRIPCGTFAAYWAVDRLIKRFTVAARPGAYLRVLTEGLVSAGDELHVLQRPAHGLTIGETFRALTGERELAPKLLTAPELPASVHARVRGWLAASPR